MNRDIPGYDLWKLDTPDNHLREVGKCGHCEKSIYTEEYHVLLQDGRFHSECLWEMEQEKHYEELEDQ